MGSPSAHGTLSDRWESRSARLATLKELSRDSVVKILFAVQDGAQTIRPPSFSRLDLI